LLWISMVVSDSPKFVAFTLLLALPSFFTAKDMWNMMLRLVSSNNMIRYFSINLNIRIHHNSLILVSEDVILSARKKINWIFRFVGLILYKETKSLQTCYTLSKLWSEHIKKSFEFKKSWEGDQITWREVNLENRLTGNWKSRFVAKGASVI
jgi:hypothetical protein